jgi:hypothetical protein
VKVPQETCHSIPEEIYKNACVTTTEEAVASCQVVGYPAMIKASWGGGGKGIRKVSLLFGSTLSQLYGKSVLTNSTWKCPLSIQNEVIVSANIVE